jgi:hypothetical protein
MVAGRCEEDTHEKRNARRMIATMTTTSATHRPQLSQVEEQPKASQLYIIVRF